MDCGSPRCSVAVADKFSAYVVLVVYGLLLITMLHCIININMNITIIIIMGSTLNRVDPKSISVKDMYIYIYIYTQIHTYIHTYIYTYIYVLHETPLVLDPICPSLRFAAALPGAPGYRAAAPPGDGAACVI